jgi:secondary thiamine-phosphate synthase enzyme
MVLTEEIQLRTRGDCDIQDVTPQIASAVSESGLQAGIVTVFCPGSTGGLTTIEYESGALADLERLLDQIVPPGQDYRHHLRWGDDNGHSHVRSALIGPSLTVPFVDGRLTLGTWQQVIFLDFDTRARSRRLIVQVMGE